MIGQRKRERKEREKREREKREEGIWDMRGEPEGE